MRISGSGGGSIRGDNSLDRGVVSLELGEASRDRCEGEEGEGTCRTAGGLETGVGCWMGGACWVGGGCWVGVGA